MLEDQSQPPSESRSASSQSQNLLLGLVFGTVVLLLILLFIQMSGNGFGKKEDNKELEELRAELDKRKKALEERSSAIDPDTTGQNARALSDRITTDSAALAGLVKQLQDVLNNTRTDLNTARTANQQLSQQALQAGQAAALQSQLTAAENKNAQLQTQVQSLTQQLSSAPSATALASKQGELEQMKLSRDTLQAEVDRLQQQLTAIQTSGEAATLRADLQRLNAENARLTEKTIQQGYEIQRLRGELNRSRLFVEAEALPAKAKLLYDELAKLQVNDQAALLAEYERIKGALGATVIDKIAFQTGSSNVPQDKEEEIRRVLQTSPEETFYLVVGYASKVGDLVANRKLSANRATRIAAITDHHKKPGHGVQAVFLSETDRFHPTDNAPNQVCEIWEIPK